ncbi:hypothetical protein X089_02068 [Mycobacterium tuberculosis BTB04-172]|nr:hypothetical protein X089_02068 [Mycobacterium tuberculosis BTB04-172]
MNVPWENAHGGALYCLIRGDEFSAWHRLLFQRPGCAESVLACRHFLDGSPVARCSYPEEYHPCVISRIALLCDSVGWTADVERISAWLNGLDRETYELVFAAIEVLEEEGPQYTSIRFSERLAEAGIQPSVGAVGSSYDNALAETINGLYKTELIKPGKPWRSIEDVELATARWVDWFNHRRLYQYCGDVPPVELEAAYYAQRQRPAAG